MHNRLDINEIKEIELNILIYIDKLCKDYNLRYSLCGGTLIGAIRHKGFIPWDDDIDILMPRPDYDLFIRLLNDKNNRYYAMTGNDENYYYNFAKVVDTNTVLLETQYNKIEGMGVFVDIFPVDSFPDDMIQKKCKEIYITRHLINYYAFETIKFRKNILKWIESKYFFYKSRTYSLSDLQKKYISIVTEKPYGSTEKVFLTGAYEIVPLPLKMFEEYIEVEFEGKMFSVIKQYDDYLRTIYGDYMKLPPKEKQVTIHSFEAYWKTNRHFW